MFVSYVILKYLTEVKLWISSILLLLVSYLLSFSPFLLPWGLDIAPLCAWFILLGCKSKEKVEKIRYSFSLVCGALILYMCLIYVNGNINLSVSDFGQVNLFSFPICVLINLLFTYLIVVVFVHYGGGMFFSKASPTICRYPFFAFVLHEFLRLNCCKYHSCANENSCSRY